MRRWRARVAPPRGQGPRSTTFYSGYPAGVLLDPRLGIPPGRMRPRLAQEACRLLTPEAPAVWVPRATRDLVYVWSEVQEGIPSGLPRDLLC